MRSFIFIGVGLSLGFIAGMIGGSFLTAYIMESFVCITVEVENRHSIIDSVVNLKYIGDGKSALVVRKLEETLETGLLYIASKKVGDLSEDEREAVVFAKKYLKDHPINYVSPESKEKIEAMLNSVQ